MMTSRERLLCVLNSGIPDQVPISPFVQEDFLSYFFKKEHTSRLTDGVACARSLGFDFMAREKDYGVPHFMRKSYPNWELSCDSYMDGGFYYQVTSIKTPIRILRKVAATPYQKNLIAGASFSVVEYPIKNDADFEAFSKYVPPMDLDDRQRILQGSVISKKVIGNDGISCPWSAGGVYNLVSEFFDVKDMMMDSLCEPDYYDAYMSLFAKLIAQSNEVFAESCFAAVGIGGNNAKGAKLGSRLFDKHILKYEKAALEPLQKAGKPTVYHNCGCAKQLYDSYRKLGITCWETVAGPPRGDNDLLEAKYFFGDQMVLVGTFDQVEYLKSAAPQEIFCKAAEQMRVGKSGGHYIFAASDFLEGGTPIENVRAMIAGARSEAK